MGRKWGASARRAKDKQVGRRKRRRKARAAPRHWESKQAGPGINQGARE